MKMKLNLCENILKHSKIKNTSHCDKQIIIFVRFLTIWSIFHVFLYNSAASVWILILFSSSGRYSMPHSLDKQKASAKRQYPAGFQRDNPDRTLMMVAMLPRSFSASPARSENERLEGWERWRWNNWNAVVWCGCINEACCGTVVVAQDFRQSFKFAAGTGCFCYSRLSSFDLRIHAKFLAGFTGGNRVRSQQHISASKKYQIVDFTHACRMWSDVVRVQSGTMRLEQTLLGPRQERTTKKRTSRRASKGKDPSQNQQRTTQYTPWCCLRACVWKSFSYLWPFLMIHL